MDQKSSVSKLNIGCGGRSKKQYRNKEWINVDLIAGDVRASALALPFPRNTFDEIHAIHILEHIPRPDQDAFQQEMLRVLKPGGVYYVEVPSLYRICKNIVSLAENCDLDDPDIREKIRCWTLSLYGKHRHKGDIHHWGFMAYLLGDDLIRHGFTNVKLCDEPISRHFKLEPVILFRGSK